MTARIFRLTQVHQRIDEHLRLERRKRAPDPAVCERLQKLRSRAKRLLGRLALRAIPT
jgi:hypothetical protein